MKTNDKVIKATAVNENNFNININGNDIESESNDESILSSSIITTKISNDIISRNNDTKP